MSAHDFRVLQMRFNHIGELLQIIKEECCNGLSSTRVDRLIALADVGGLVAEQSEHLAEACADAEGRKP